MNARIFCSDEESDDRGLNDFFEAQRARERIRTTFDIARHNTDDQERKEELDILRKHI